MTEIKPCNNCRKHNITHDFQDNTYGKFVRVFNTTNTGTACTVCGEGKKNKK